mmetsp:Transcript_24500/g.59052  ORF Transcript_24500/g.59052 Transcript_24500/m.59052 type:complete len:85 (+) Transcript_24500:2714-2968(+)
MPCGGTQACLDGFVFWFEEVLLVEEKLQREASPLPGALGGAGVYLMSVWLLCRPHDQRPLGTNNCLLDESAGHAHTLLTTQLGS